MILITAIVAIAIIAMAANPNSFIDNLSLLF